MFPDKVVRERTFLPALPPFTRLLRVKAFTLFVYRSFLSPWMLGACPPVPWHQAANGGP